MKQVFLKVLFFSIFSPVFSQIDKSKNFPKGYFRDPLAIPIRLAANFGELRPDHFHMGLDIRTQRKENLPVLAAAEGYIARIRIEPFGFGQAIYINHPNGYTTLYAHLNRFIPALETYIKKQQYKMESWNLDLEIPAGLFPVKKGQQIAYSGNTGGSQGPHLHFEIRRTADDTNLNPMLFGLPIPDKTAPVLQLLAVYDRTKSIYEQSPRIIKVHNSAGRYTVPGGIIMVNSPKVGFAISASDTQSGSYNPNGIYEALLYHNETPVIGFRMNNISYAETKNINAHIDYKTKAQGGPYLQQLFCLQEFQHFIYQFFQGNGNIDVSDGLVHSFRIEVKDAYGNHSALNYKLQYLPGPGYNLDLPGRVFYPMMLDGFETDDCSFYLGEGCLYDSVHISYSKSVSSEPHIVSFAHDIGSPYIPLGNSFLVRIKPNNELAVSSTGKVVMQRLAAENYEVQKPEWQAGWASASFHNFGRFQLVLDEEPPIIIPVGISEGANLGQSFKIAFIIKDNLNSFKNFRAELDGKWLLFTNDKGKQFTYRSDEKCPPGKHELKVSVEDEAGNQAIKIFHFNRL
jgi:murein DD-endopeptidase MepM/ murein hydrolase activator NlpD